MTTIAEIRDSIVSLDAMIDSTADLLKSGVPSEDRSEIAAIAVDLNNTLANLKNLYSILSSDIINRLEYTPEPISVDGGEVEIRSGSARKAWDHDRLSSVVAKRISDSSVDITTGEIVMNTEQMIQEILKYAAVSYWRVGALKDLDLVADNYCDVSEPKQNLIVKKK